MSSNSTVHFVASKLTTNSNLGRSLLEQIVAGWMMYKLPMGGLDKVNLPWVQAEAGTASPALHLGEVIVDVPMPTWIDVRGWGHGVIVVNGFNIGKFSDRGPQAALFVPKSVLIPGANSLVVFESDPPHNATSKLARMSAPPSMDLIDHMIWLREGPRSGA